jgi:hypothetical protein
VPFYTPQQSLIKAILSAKREKNLRVSSLPDARNPHQIYPLEESLGIVFLLMQIEKKARLLAHGGCSSLAEISTGGLGFVDTLGEDGSIFVLKRR